MKGYHALQALAAASFLYLVFLHSLMPHSRSIQESSSALFNSTLPDTTDIQQANNDDVCLTDECIQQVALSLARPFPDRHNQSTWCLPRSRVDSLFQGLLFVKVFKSGSTTAAAVALRLAHKYRCAVQWDHKPAVRYTPYHTQRSFWFTSIRQPSTRAISAIYFYRISHLQEPDTDTTLLDHLQHDTKGFFKTIVPHHSGFTLHYIHPHRDTQQQAWSPQQPTRVQNATYIHSTVRHVLQHYDFIVVSERMDESLVALALILNINLGDVLVTGSKQTTHYHWDGRDCHKLVSHRTTSPTVQAYLDSDEWRAMNYGDLLLHAAAQYSLDQTIARLGTRRFQSALEEYRRLRDLEERLCRPTVQWPCSHRGTPQTHISKQHCYKDDLGCGYKCIDALLKNETRLLEYDKRKN